MMNIAAAILHLRPDACYQVADNDYATLIWESDGEPPTLAECKVAWKEIERDYLLRPIRAERSQLLVASDWTQLADAPVDAAAWAEYRQALRDLPAKIKNPTAAFEWPERPE
jgi:hypothetical protein